MNDWMPLLGWFVAALSSLAGFFFLALQDDPKAWILFPVLCFSQSALLTAGRLWR